MEILIERYDELARRGAIRQGGWGNGHLRACLMSALVTGAKSEADCVAKGWPLWLAEMAVLLFDGYPTNVAIERGRVLATAIANADKRGVEWDSVFRLVRLDAILPIAMESIGEGDEPWRTACRDVVQWSITHGGAVPRADSVPRAAGAAEAVAAVAAVAAAGAAGAFAAIAAAAAAGADARERIERALINAMSSAE